MWRRSIDQLFDTLFAHRRLDDVGDVAWEPAVEMFEDANEVVVRAVVPNIDPKHIAVTVADNRLTLKGEMRHEKEESKRTHYRRELRYGIFVRVLAAEVMRTEAKATYKIEIKIPKSENVKSGTIKVQLAA